LQIPDEAVKVNDDTVTISLENATVVDQFTFPGGAGANLGIAGVPATISFDITYSKSGARRQVEPTSSDSLSPFNWEGEIWDATNSGTFKLSYNDGSFSAQGSFDSAGNFGEMGFERNGSFVEHEDGAEGQAENVGGAAKLAATPATPNTAQKTQSAQQAPSGPKFRGKIPVRELIH
jgi:hypothetical protein